MTYHQCQYHKLMLTSKLWNWKTIMMIILQCIINNLHMGITHAAYLSVCTYFVVCGILSFHITKVIRMWDLIEGHNYDIVTICREHLEGQIGPKIVICHSSAIHQKHYFVKNQPLNLLLKVEVIFVQWQHMLYREFLGWNCEKYPWYMTHFIFFAKSLDRPSPAGAS